jgi:hypothetical protein
MPKTGNALLLVFPRPPFGFFILASNSPAFRSARSLMTVAVAEDEFKSASS